MSYYLKYRPQKTSELDIASVRDFYSGLLSSGSFSHAYLFSGPRGTGKTSSARILAKVINCESNRKSVLNNLPLNEPCGKCDTCKRITVGNSLSVIEMDAASNRGIDDIRALRDRISLAPAESPFVIYIIDEVHMLTTEAFNALLKTLEEPPAHAVFALCTTEFQKLPQTVVSRCTQVLFSKATVEEVITSLKKAVDGEKIHISQDALKILAQSVDGSFRDGMKLLEQLTQKGTVITDEAVLELTHQTSQYDVRPFIQALLTKNAQTAFEILGEMEKQSVDVGVFVGKILDELRLLLRTAMKENTQQTIDLLTLIESTAQAGLAVKTSYAPLLPLEILVVQRSLMLPLEENREKNVVLSTPNQSLKVELDRNEIVQNKKILPQPKSKEELPRQQSRSGKVSLAEVENKWHAILAQVKPLNHSLEALLRSSRPLSVDDSVITIEVFYAFHRDRLDEEKNKVAIEKAIENVMGEALRLSFILGSGENKIPSAPAVSLTKKPAETDLELAAQEIFG